MIAEDSREHQRECGMGSTRRPVEPRDLLEIAVDVAESAAGMVARMRESGPADGVSTKTTETDLVTAADREAERLITEGLRRARPDDAILGEETGAHAGAGASGVRWIVDPIDGTVNYVYGLAQYAVSVAAEMDGEVVAGVVHNPVTGDRWTATRGGGAWRGGRRLRGSTATKLGQCLVATGFGYDPARRAHQAEVLARLMSSVRDIRRFG